MEVFVFRNGVIRSSGLSCLDPDFMAPNNFARNDKDPHVKTPPPFPTLGL